jgi:hypothetical protein
MIRGSFEIHDCRPLRFVVERFGHLFKSTSTLERWMRDGRLNQAAAGEPSIPPAHLKNSSAASLAR